MSYEAKHPFIVTIQGLGTKRVLAEDDWTAVQVAFGQYRHLQPNKEWYKAKRVRYKTKKGKRV